MQLASIVAIPIYSASRLGRHRRERKEARIKTRGEYLPYMVVWRRRDPDC
jgi:hypothetical protein